MYSDGYLKLLTDAGYIVVHEKSSRGTFSEKMSVRTVVYKDLKAEPVTSLEQTHGSMRGGDSIAGVYRALALKLGVIESTDEAPLPLDLRVTEEGEYPHQNIRFNHPSFGAAVLTRYQGDGRQFMSPINTGGGMTLRIHEAELTHHTDLGTDHVFPGRLLCEVRMSCTQFAELITSQGVGEGVPVTIGYVEGISRHSVELPTFEERIEKNMKRSMDEAVSDLTAFVAEINAEMSGTGGLSAGRKKEVWEKITRAMHKITGKPQWLLSQWREHVNTTVSHARSEFAHYARDHAHKAAAMADGIIAPALAEKTEESE